MTRARKCLFPLRKLKRFGMGPQILKQFYNCMIEMEVGMATQSCVNREYRRGLRTHLCGAPVLRISGVEMLNPTLTTWGRPVRKSRTQLHRAGSRPRVSSLMKSLEGTMVLNAEL